MKFGFFFGRDGEMFEEKRMFVERRMFVEEKIRGMGKVWER